MLVIKDKTVKYRNARRVCGAVCRLLNAITDHVTDRCHVTQFTVTASASFPRRADSRPEKRSPCTRSGSVPVVSGWSAADWARTSSPVRRAVRRSIGSWSTTTLRLVLLLSRHRRDHHRRRLCHRRRQHLHTPQTMRTLSSRALFATGSCGMPMYLLTSRQTARVQQQPEQRAQQMVTAYYSTCRPSCCRRSRETPAFHCRASGLQW